MDYGQNVYKPISMKFYDPKEECIYDKDYDVFDLVLSASDMVGFKNQDIRESRV